MKDHNDFFDEMIDVDDDSDGEPAEFLEEEDDYEVDEEDEDEDDGSTVVARPCSEERHAGAALSEAAPDCGQLVR